LTKVDKNAPPIEFPWRCCQIIVRHQFHLKFHQVEKLETTKRGEDGFGSTGK
jgi:dUTPase